MNSTGAGGSIGGTGNGPAANPFKMPTEEEVFMLRDEERRQKALERERAKYMRVEEKGIKPPRQVFTRADRMVATADAEYLAANGGGGATQSIHASATLALPAVDKRMTENMAEYIAKKRKLGLAKMALATKRQEIKKLDEEAERAEKRIEQMEEQLKETHGKFSAFLQHSEMEQVEATRRAEYETKQKQDKHQDIKKLNALISQIDTDRRKHEEQLVQCREYKRFLDQLTPPSHFAAVLADYQKEELRAAKAAEIEARLASELRAFDAAALQSEAGEDGAEPVMDPAVVANIDAERQQALQEELDNFCETEFARVDEEIRLMAPEDVKAAVDQLDPDAFPMFFTDPATIRDKFVEIEEGNLFLITTCQELEEEIEGIAAQYKQEQQEMVELAQTRRQQMETIEKKIAAEEGKIHALGQRIKAADDKEATGHGSQEDLKVKIEERVRRTYSEVRPDDPNNADTLAMLTQIEVRLEALRLQITETVENTHVTAVMKARDNERRQKARLEHLRRQEADRERRSAAALKRSEAPVKKRVGKPVMWRSRPLDDKKQDTNATTVDAANEDDEFFM